MAKKPGKVKSRPRWRQRLPYVAMLLCIGLAVLAVYVVHLDGVVRARFEGARWTLPAKVYASPLQLYVGRQMGPGSVQRALQRLGYSDTNRLAEPGSYHHTDSGLDIYSRPFDFWDGKQPAERVSLTFSHDTITHMKGLKSHKSVPLLRLDPLLIGSIYPAHNGADRILVQLKDVPPLLPAGLIVVEDRSFMHNIGISFQGIARAAWMDLRAGKVVQGGSTITQQLVKNLFLNNRQTLARKAKEALMAILLDMHYSKQEILETYLNEVYLGQDGGRSIHGFALASHFFFHKPVSELDPQDIALLVGMVKGPSYYNPRTHPKLALQRRNLVLKLFLKAGFITKQAARKAIKSPLGVASKASATASNYPAFIDLVRKQLLKQYRDKDLTQEGLRIFTTLNPRIQAVAEQRVKKGLARLEQSHHMKQDTLQSAAVVTSVENGRVLAMVGGRNPQLAGYNRALNARRQIGSLIKPVVYLTALDQPGNYSVVTPLDDGPLSLKLPNGKTWSPHNYEHVFHGHHVPLYQCLAHSYNVATARLAVNIGIPKIVKTLKKLGYPGNPEPLPSLALGAIGMSAFQVAQIYNTLAAGGFYTPLKAIRAVTTRQGEPLSRYPLELYRAMDPQSVYLVDWILERVTHHGTGRSAYYTLPSRLNVAGKTGTSSDWHDSWFAGFGGNRVTVVWVGRDDNKSTHLTGATGALQIWAHIMRDIHPRSFNPLKPDGIVTMPLVLRKAENNKDKPAAIAAGPQDCSRAVAVPFMDGYVPNGVKPCGADSQKKDHGGGFFQGLF